MTITNVWKRIVAPFKRAGSAFASFLGTYGVGTPGAWGGNRYEQVRHFTGWNYVGIKAICDEFAGSPPQVAIRRDESEIAAVKAKGGRFLSAKARTKALTSTQEGEDLQVCDSDHRLVKLLHNPNGPDVSWSFNYKLMLSLELTGMAYVWMVPDALGLPAELWVIPPHWVFAVRESADTLVTEYEIRPRGTTYSGPTVRRPADEFISIAYPHPFEPLEGYSPSQACAMWMDIAESVDQCRWSNFKNGIHGRTIITLDKDIADPDADTINRFRENFKARYGGESNAGEPIILSPGAGVADMRQSPTEMDYTGSTDQLRDMLMSARGVGKSIVGITEDVNFASSISATANFRFRTMRPKKTFIGQVLTEKLAKRFDERLAIYWPDDTPDDPAHELARMQAATAAGAVTPNEWREFIGLPPYPFGGDDPMLPMGLSPQPWQTGKTKPRPSVPMPGANGSTNGFAKPPGVGESSVPQATSDVSRIAAYFRNGRYKGGDFREEDHPRDDDGKFGSGGGTTVKPKPAASKPQAKPGTSRSVPEAKPSEKAARAKAAHKLVDKAIQRYAEEHNEPRFARVVKGVSHPDSEPMDVTAKNGDLIELKTIVDNSNAKITMDSYSQVRKIVREKEEGTTFHTVVSDDSHIYKPDGNHDESAGRTYYYRRGVAGSARIGSMYKCKNEAELKKLMTMPEEQLPVAAKRTDAKLRVGKWKFFQDEQGKGYKNAKTGVVFRAKK